MGRAHYIRNGEEIDEASARSFPSSREHGLSHLEMSTIAAFNGFQLPSASTRQELMGFFMQYCSRWMPIMHENDVASILNGTSSPLLAQALYVAATRVSSAPISPAEPSIKERYERAKILFWMGHESNPINSVKATLLMQWYNPEGPEHVSLDTSEFWMRTGVGLAYQIGLHKEPVQGPWYSMRRRIWWSLVARDSLISAAHGRPRAINLNDCEVSPPRAEDFHDPGNDGNLFVRYVEICRMLGDLTDYCNRGFLPSPQRFQMESALHRWLEDMPSDFRLSDTPGVENFASRQLHLPYLMSVMIFARFTSKRVSRTAVLAASYCAGIFETFLARDEIRFLAPVFTIYCISSGFTLLTLFDHPNLWSSAQTDMNIILKSLSQLSKNWRSAIGGLKALQAAIKRKER
ncbi:hypothetical protein IQ06DRAFT_243908, partial [Phaeosphaeriaceae sp. SRC1lsM3a]